MMHSYRLWPIISTLPEANPKKQTEVDVLLLELFSREQLGQFAKHGWIETAWGDIPPLVM